MSKKRIAIVGAGAVGGYVGASLTAGGHDVVMIDPWPEHGGLRATRTPTAGCSRSHIGGTYSGKD